MSKTVVEFSQDELKNMLEDPDSCIETRRDVYSLALYPYHLCNFQSSVKALLNAKVAKYERRLDGILIGYTNVTLSTSEGTIVSDSCHVHIDIEADFYIFKPKVGSSLIGIVNKKSEDHVGCLVHRVFNISVPQLDKNHDWIGHRVEIGQEVVLNVTHVDLEARLPYIRADFDPKHFPDVDVKETKYVVSEKTHNRSNDEVDSTTPKHKKNKSKNSAHTELLNSFDLAEQLETPKIKKEKRKSKNIIEDFNTEDELTIHKKKKKDKHKSQNRNNEDDQTDSRNGVSEYIHETVDIKYEAEEEPYVDDFSIDKIRKDKENTTIKKKKKSTIIHDFELQANGSQEEKKSSKKKRKHVLEESQFLVDEHLILKNEENIKKENSRNDDTINMVADTKNHKIKKHRKSVSSGDLSSEIMTLKSHDSDLEKKLSEELFKENITKIYTTSHKKHEKDKSDGSAIKRKRKKSITISNEESHTEEPKFKKRKLDDDSFNDSSLNKKHKSKKKHNSIDT